MHAQVVANAILNNQTSPVANAFFQTLEDLNANLVRYGVAAVQLALNDTDVFTLRTVPWFPYPSVGVAELVWVCAVVTNEIIFRSSCLMLRATIHSHTHVLVLAQEPPNYNTNTSYWNFTNIIPQLTAFMDATYGKGYQVCV